MESEKQFLFLKGTLERYVLFSVLVNSMWNFFLTAVYVFEISIEVFLLAWIEVWNLHA